MRKFGIGRETLAKIAPNPQALRELERAFDELGLMPSTIEEAAAQANQAIALAGSLLAFAQDLAQQVEALASMPAQAPPQEPDDFAPRWPEPSEPDDTAPRVQLGTISSQDADNVDIDGGSIDGTAIGSDVAASAAFTTVNASGLIASTVADGAPPLSVMSATLVDNLYVARAQEADHAADAATADYADSAGEADSLTSPTTYPADATDLSSAITLVNALKGAAISKGL